MLRWLQDAAQGMAYLHAQRFAGKLVLCTHGIFMLSLSFKIIAACRPFVCRCVHRDLKSANMLVDRGLNLKVESRK